MRAAARSLFARVIADIAACAAASAELRAFWAAVCGELNLKVCTKPLFRDTEPTATRLLFIRVSADPDARCWQQSARL